ncbi:MAG: hypothetical protein HY678_01700 [Chloroflexi bacterium]|nr:hypothetical protein [Chloroflexota bacterium]
MAESVIDLELQPKDTYVKAASYYDALGAFLALLREVDAVLTMQAGESGHKVVWLVHLKNPTIPLIAESVDQDIDVTRKARDMVLSVLETLQDRPFLPSGLSYTALERAQDLSDVIARDGVSEVIIRAEDREVRVTDRLGVNVREIMGQKVEVLGSVEGELEMVTLRNRRYFNVYDALTGKATKCFFVEGLSDRVREALGRYVTVSGTIRTFARGEGREVTDIQDLQIIDPAQQLPGPSDVRGIWPRTADSPSAETYVKERWLGRRKEG